MKTFNVRVLVPVIATVTVAARSAQAAERIVEQKRLTGADLQEVDCRCKPDMVWQGETAQALPVQIRWADQAPARSLDPGAHRLLPARHRYRGMTGRRR